MKKRLFFFCAAALLLSGCQDTVNTVANREKTMKQEVVQDARMTTDSFLKNRLLLKQVTVSKTEDGLKRVQLEILNRRVGFFPELWSHIRGQNPYRIRYKFVWYRQNGMVSDAGVVSDWQDVTVMPGETLFLRSVAPEKDCADFKISLKENNR